MLPTFLKALSGLRGKSKQGENNYFLKLLSTSWVNQAEPIKRHFLDECFFPAVILGLEYLYLE